MTLWIDNQLPPALAGWMRATFFIDCLPVRDLNLQRATDPEIFAAARSANAVVLTKDADFVELLEKHRPPPQVVLVTCGNTSNARLARRRPANRRWDSAAVLTHYQDSVDDFFKVGLRRASMMGTCRKATCGFAAGGLVFVVSACGDSSTSSGTTSPSPTVANGDF